MSDDDETSETESNYDYEDGSQVTDDSDEETITIDTKEVPTAKWLGCANHTLQLALKVLSEEAEFKDPMNSIVKTLKSIRKSTNAVRDFNELTNRSVKLPVVTR